MKDKKRIFYIDVLKVVAMFFVIFNHTMTRGYSLFLNYSPSSFTYWIYLFISIFCKFAVPIFFCTSGVLLLYKKDESLKVIFKKRVFKYVLFIILAALIYYCNYLRLFRQSFSLVDFSKYLYVKPISDHLWFLYYYVAFLLMLPFLRVIVKSLKDSLYYYLIALSLLFVGIIPVIDFLISDGSVSLYTEIVPIVLLATNFIYPLIGYFLHYKFKSSNSARNLFLLWIVNIISIGISAFMTFYYSNFNVFSFEASFQVFFGNFVIINCITIFFTIKYIFYDKKVHVPTRIKSFICSMSSCCFGIYLIHVLIMNSKFFKNMYSFLNKHCFSSIVAALIWCLIIFLFSYIVVFLLKKILYYIKYFIKKKRHV